MSGKIENKHDFQRPNLSTLTMKLKCKFNSPRLKRSPLKNIIRTPEEQVRKIVPKPVRKSISRLEEQEKEVVSALQYFKIIVGKMVQDSRVLEMLPGSASKVLEAVLALVQTEPTLKHCSAVSSCLGRIYQSLANLIHWSDQVLLNGVNREDKESTVTTVIKAVLDGVKELVRLTMEPQENTSLTPPVKPATSSDTTPAQPDQTFTVTTTSASAPALAPALALAPASALALTPVPAAVLYTAPDVDPLAPEEGEKRGSMMETLTTAHLQPAQPLSLPVLWNNDAPPKPPLCSGNTSENNPPALPPKRRSSASLPTPRIAVIAPMRQSNLLPIPNIQDCEVKCVSDSIQGCVLERTSLGGSWWWDGGSPCLSINGSSQEKLNQLDGNSSTHNSSDTLDTTGDQYDPDYDFLLEDLSSVGALPHQGDGLSLADEAPNHEPSSFSNHSALPPPALPEKKRRNPTCTERSLSVYDNISQENNGPIPPFPLFLPMFPRIHEEDGPPNSPPPLPEKKSLQIMQYMQFMEDYCEPQPSMFYNRTQSERSYHLRNRRFQEAYQLTDTLPPPSLPPKQRQLETSVTEECLETQSSESLRRASSDLDLTEDCKLSSQEKADLLLVDHSEIKSRLALKPEDDDCPDVRAGHGDILLVHATETDHQDVEMYCEAFLTTYRTFMTPDDLIKKLHYRYSRFCHSTDTNRKVASRNSFCVLVRVVDELCGVELSEQLLRLLMELVFQLLIGGELNRARLLRSNILDKLEQRRKLNSTLSLCPLAARGVAARPGTLHDFRSHEIAEQLTLMDAVLFYKIEIPEVLLWAKEQNEERSPNLTQFTEHFNNMSYWVRSLIMLQEKAQDREKLLLKFIRVMKFLRKLNNFNSYLAILSALDSAPLRRLEWQRQTSESLEEYSTLIDSSSSFRTYRAALAEVQTDFPCIPYLGLILQDLTFVHLGNPDLVEDKVNFSKRWQQFNILDSMRCFQQIHYDIKHNDDIVSFFNDFNDHLAEEALWELSLKIKPRNPTRRTEQQDRT